MNTCGPNLFLAIWIKWKNKLSSQKNLRKDTIVVSSSNKIIGFKKRLYVFGCIQIMFTPTRYIRVICDKCLTHQLSRSRLATHINWPARQYMLETMFWIVLRWRPSFAWIIHISEHTSYLCFCNLSTSV